MNAPLSTYYCSRRNPNRLSGRTIGGLLSRLVLAYRPDPGQGGGLVASYSGLASCGGNMRTKLASVRTLVVGLLLTALLIGLAPAPSTAAAGEKWCPVEAQFCSENAFLDFWKGVDEETGGYALDIIGFPISPALQRPSDGLIVQFYERAIFEWHPEKPRQYQVLLT